MDDVVNRLEKNLTLNKVSLALEALESLDNVMPILERMPNLINLDLHGNKLSKLPRDLSKLKKLSTLTSNKEPQVPCKRLFKKSHKLYVLQIICTNIA